MLPRKNIAEASVSSNGVILVVTSRDSMARLADEIAPEHLSIHAERPEELFDRIGAAGAAFVGPDTPEAAGDYLAGPSHVLPTGGAVRYGSPLGVYDFIARTSYIAYGPEHFTRMSQPSPRSLAPKGSKDTLGPPRCAPQSARPAVIDVRKRR